MTAVARLQIRYSPPMSQPARAGPRPSEQSVALSALLLGAAAVGLIAFALAHLPAGLAALGLLTEPVAAALLALAVLAEPITAWQAAGGVIILWGIFIARKGYA